MAILPTSAERAQSSVTKAEATVTEWQNKAADTRAEIAELDATAGAAILEDASAADRISLQVQSLQGKARAYDQAAAEAKKNLRNARIAVLTTEADTLEKSAAEANKRADKHEAAVQKLLVQLEDLDESKWVRGPIEGDDKSTYAGKASGIRWEALGYTTRAQSIRYWLNNGKLPYNLHDLNAEFGQTHEAYLSVYGTDGLDKYGDPITENLRAAVSAGLIVPVS